MESPTSFSDMNFISLSKILKLEIVPLTPTWNSCRSKCLDLCEIDYEKSQLQEWHCERRSVARIRIDYLLLPPMLKIVVNYQR
eukprot:1121609-Amphidinium_carterae.1